MANTLLLRNLSDIRYFSLQDDKNDTKRSN